MESNISLVRYDRLFAYFVVGAKNKRIYFSFISHLEWNHILIWLKINENACKTLVSSTFKRYLENWKQTTKISIVKSFSENYENCFENNATSSLDAYNFPLPKQLYEILKIMKLKFHLKNCAILNFAKNEKFL